MKTIMLATAAVLGLGVGAAYAESEGGVVANSYFTEIPGVVAQPPVQAVPGPVAGNQANGAPIAAFATRHNTSTWQEPPSGGANS